MGGVSKSIKKISKGDIRGVADLGLQSVTAGQVNTNGLKDGELGGVGDILFGKKNKGIKDSYVPLDPLQKNALSKYGSLLNTNTDNLAGSIIANQEKQIRSGAADAGRKASELVAQRGLGNSSVGLNALLNTQRDIGDKIGTARAQLPNLQYDLKVKNLANSTNGIQDILNSRIFKQGTPGGGRTGGLLPLVTGGLGAAFGGAGGAQIGMGLGQYATQMG